MSQDPKFVRFFKYAGIVLGAVIAGSAVVSWIASTTVTAIRKPIMAGLAEERIARVSADSTLLSELRIMRSGQLYMIEALDADPHSRERERVLRAARRMLNYGPYIPDDSRH
jgi:hypothetical protein